ncbi:hypothetical protein PM082_015822 [Marasmius tenuissimus]|nr:hypothetical protein PM082_015822 [Marasmius tenuissimus]
MDYSDRNLRSVLHKELSPPDVTREILNDTIDRLLELYPDIPALGSPYNTGNETFGLPRGYKRWTSIHGDLAFDSQRRLWQQTASNAGVKTYGYLFTQPQPDSGPLGVTHAVDLPYVFGNVTSATDVFLSHLMIDYWVSFATSLDPNDGKGFPRPTWESYTPEKQVLLELNSANTRLIPDDYRKEQFEFINQNPKPFFHRRWICLPTLFFWIRLTRLFVLRSHEAPSGGSSQLRSSVAPRCTRAIFIFLLAKSPRGIAKVSK